MKIKKIALSLASVALLAMPSYILADDMEEEEYEFPIDVSGELIGNYGVYKNAGETHNPLKNADGTNQRHNIGTQSLAEVKARLFLNQELSDTVSWHGELDFNRDWAAIAGYNKTRINSQYDWLRELYVDIQATDNLSMRLGKQQVVWGKADGVKFLDIINPTDFRHWGQDSMEDSRIPLWMLNAEYQINDNSSFQMVYVPQVNVTNQIPGLYNVETGDQGQQFVPLGTDALFGQYNGFYNIGPDLGAVAGVFYQNFGGTPGITSGNLVLTTNQTVSTYVAGALGGSDANLAGAVNFTNPTTNLFSGTLNTNNPQTMFDYMGDTTFSTFDAFVGLGTKYIKKHARNDFKNGNIGFKYAGTNDDIGLNYTFNYYYHYDNNPVIDISWEDGAGNALTAYADTTTPNFTTIKLRQANGTDYNTTLSGGANMVFTEKQNRINTFGTSFDYALDTALAPVIIRSEIVYDKRTLVPVVDLGKLAYGDLAGAFTNQKADFLNYVVGVDVTVMRNLFMSFQFMDKWNLDYVNQDVQYQGNTRKYSKHTANPATMSLSNGFRAGEEHAIAYTFFLSKPFLEGDALRVNNIVLVENQAGGWWDRLDFEYSYSDDIVLTGAMNQYGGDSNGVFGQFQNMSNIQLGFKYIF